MPLFRRPEGDGGRASREALERGELPPAALARLKAGGPWTSDLSVGEFALTLADGWRPKGLVMGTSVYRISWSGLWAATPGAFGGGPWGGGYWGGPVGTESDTLVQAIQACRRQAVHRMGMEALALKAHGVLAVRIGRTRWDWGQGLAEFQTFGTAVERRGAAPVARPFSGAVSGIEASQLLRAGQALLGVVAGTSLVYVSGMEAAMIEQSWATYSNQPLRATTRAVIEARESAVARMRQEAEALEADGIVGVRLKVQTEEIELEEPKRTDHLLQIDAIGTAVGAFAGSTARSTRPVVDMG